MASHDELISNFCEMTGSNAAEATKYLSAVNWALGDAIASYFADRDDLNEQESLDEGSASVAPAPEPEPAYTGPRTLDGRPAPEYASYSASKSSDKNKGKRTGLQTFSSLGGGHAHDDDDDEDDDARKDDDDERRGPRDLFAGGEKSGLAVQDPSQSSSGMRKLVDDIVKKAKADTKQAQAEGAPSRSSFRGTGMTLGGDGVESRAIPDPRGEPIPRQVTAAPDQETQQRTLHLWADGFSIDDGPLKRLDDPMNARDLQMIRQGRAPVHLMNVQPNQPIEVNLERHTENWRQLPRIYRPFGGQGHRLGSPVPGDGNSVQMTEAPAAAASSSSAGASSSRPAPTSVDESQPTVMLRIQLPDGTRLPARFNTSQTIGDVYDFVARAMPSSDSRPWVVATTFPSKDHTDKDLVLTDVPEFQKGGTAVVKWT